MRPLFAAVLLAASAGAAFAQTPGQTPPGQTPPSQPRETPVTPDRPAGSPIGSPATGSQPGGLGSSGEGGVTAGSLGIGAGPAAVVNPPGAAIRDPLRPSGAAGPLRQDTTSPDAPTPPAAADGDWSATGGAVPPPAGYAGAPSDWARHVQACQARYRTYDPATDTFFARAGVKARCRL